MYNRTYTQQIESKLKQRSDLFYLKIHNTEKETTTFYISPKTPVSKPQLRLNELNIVFFSVMRQVPLPYFFNEFFYNNHNNKLFYGRAFFLNDRSRNNIFLKKSLYEKAVWVVIVPSGKVAEFYAELQETVSITRLDILRKLFPELF